MKNLLLLSIFTFGFSFCLANNEMKEGSNLTENAVLVIAESSVEEAMDCGLLANTTVQILNNMGFPESGTEVIGNIILGICETIFN